MRNSGPGAFPRLVIPGRDVYREPYSGYDEIGRVALYAPKCYQNIPGSLRDRPQWVGYLGKVPIAPNAEAADATDPSTWGTYDSAVDLRLWRKAAGIGYVFSADDPFVGIDLDKVIDPADGSIPPWVSALVEYFATYTELSPSGTGLHLFLRAKLPSGFRGGPRRIVLPDGQRGQIEVYDRDRYFRMTGDAWRSHGAGRQIEEGQDLLDALLANSTRGSSNSAKPSRRAAEPTPATADFDIEDFEQYALGIVPVPPGAGHEVLKDLAIRYFKAGLSLDDIAEALGGVLTTGESEVIEARDRSDLPRLLGWLADHDPRSGAARPLEVRPGGRWAAIAARVLGRQPVLLPVGEAQGPEPGVPEERDPRLVQYSNNEVPAPGHGHEATATGHRPQGDRSPLHKSGKPEARSRSRSRNDEAARADEELAASECHSKNPCSHPRPVTLRRRGDPRGVRNIWVRCRSCDGCRQDMIEDWFDRTRREIEAAGWIEATMCPADRSARFLEAIKGTGARYIRVRCTGGLETFIVVWKEVRETEIGFRVAAKEDALTVAREALERIEWSLPKGTRKLTASKDWGGKAPEEAKNERWEIAPVQVRCSREETARRLRTLGVQPRFISVPTRKGTFCEGVEWTIPAGVDPDMFLWRLAEADPAGPSGRARGDSW